MTAGPLSKSATVATQIATDRPRISYVLATWNRAAFLRQALEQTRDWIDPRDELIVIDGGSTDDTRSVVASFGNLISRFVSEPDRGEAHAFNKGVLESRGYYVKFLSDDDQLSPEGLRQAAEILARRPEIDVLLCGGDSYVRQADGSLSFVRNISLPRGISIAKNLHAVLFQASCGVGLFVSRRAIAWVGLLDPSFKAVDSDYLARLCYSGLDIRYAHLRLFRHVEHPHSGQRQRGRMIADVLRIMHRYRRYDLMAWWVGSALMRRLTRRQASDSTYRGGGGDWDGSVW